MLPHVHASGALHVFLGDYSEKYLGDINENVHLTVSQPPTITSHNAHSEWFRLEEMEALIIAPTYPPCINVRSVMTD
jgi:hypothetical protein